eukprot:2259959-Prymnesium_polylepis.1
MSALSMVGVATNALVGGARVLCCGKCRARVGAAVRMRVRCATAADAASHLAKPQSVRWQPTVEHRRRRGSGPGHRKEGGCVGVGNDVTVCQKREQEPRHCAQPRRHEAKVWLAHARSIRWHVAPAQPAEGAGLGAPRPAFSHK